jgi:hypothetical protein
MSLSVEVPKTFRIAELIQNFSYHITECTNLNGNLIPKWNNKFKIIKCVQVKNIPVQYDRANIYIADKCIKSEEIKGKFRCFENPIVIAPKLTGYDIAFNLKENPISTVKQNTSIMIEYYEANISDVEMKFLLSNQCYEIYSEYLLYISIDKGPIYNLDKYDQKTIDIFNLPYKWNIPNIYSKKKIGTEYMILLNVEYDTIKVLDKTELVNSEKEIIESKDEKIRVRYFMSNINEAEKILKKIGINYEIHIIGKYEKILDNEKRERFAQKQLNFINSLLSLKIVQ